MFTSKLCHFLVPCIFPVVDNEAMGNPFSTYREYFLAGQTEWIATDARTQDRLIKILKDAVGEGRTSKAHDDSLFDRFPIKCKLIELCTIGHYNQVTR